MRNKMRAIIVIIVVLFVALSMIACKSADQEQAANNGGEQAAGSGSEGAAGSGSEGAADSGGEGAAGSGGDSAADSGGGGAAGSGGDSAATVGSDEGDAAPDFSVELLSGGTFTLSEQRGKAVFLNFWATWCPPCVAEMPAIQELSEKYAGEVVFIGVDLAENPEKVRDFISKNGYTYHIGLDETGGISQSLYPTDGIPFTLIIDAKGIITKTFLGGGANMHQPFEDAITKALG